MATFKTTLDDNPLTITIIPSSDALLDGSNKILITIYNEDEPKKWRKIQVEEPRSKKFTADIVKIRLVKRPIIKIRTNFIVDNVSLKEQIAKVTTVAYQLEDTTSTENYVSIYDEGFDLGASDDETFSVTQRIEVLFI